MHPYVEGRDGALVYLDFGMVVEVPAHARRAMIRGLVGFVNRDAASMVRDLQTLDFLPPQTDVQAGGVSTHTTTIKKAAFNRLFFTAVHEQ